MAVGGGRAKKVDYLQLGAPNKNIQNKRQNRTFIVLEYPFGTINSTVWEWVSGWY